MQKSRGVGVITVNFKTFDRVWGLHSHEWLCYWGRRDVLLVAEGFYWV